jgi:hypothetical protein
VRGVSGSSGRLTTCALLLALPLAAVAVAADSPPADTAPDQAVPTTSAPTTPPASDKPAAPPAATASPPDTPAAAPPQPQNLLPIFPSEATGTLGKKVQGAEGEDMGRVVDILVDGDGQPRAAVIDFGGFLGVGSRKVAVDWRLLQFRPTDRKAPIQLGVTRAAVQAAPEYKEKSEPTQVVSPPADTPATPPPGETPAAPNDKSEPAPAPPAAAPAAPDAAK